MENAPKPPTKQTQEAARKLIATGQGKAPEIGKIEPVVKTSILLPKSYHWKLRAHVGLLGENLSEHATQVVKNYIDTLDDFKQVPKEG